MDTFKNGTFVVNRPLMDVDRVMERRRLDDGLRTTRKPNSIYNAHAYTLTTGVSRVVIVKSTFLSAHLERGSDDRCSTLRPRRSGATNSVNPFRARRFGRTVFVSFWFLSRAIMLRRTRSCLRRRNNRN